MRLKVMCFVKCQFQFLQKRGCWLSLHNKVQHVRMWASVSVAHCTCVTALFTTDTWILLCTWNGQAVLTDAIIIQKLFFFLFYLLFTGVAARETAQALRTLAQAARGVAASTKEPQAAAAMLDSAQYVMEGSAMLIHEAHQALVHPGDAESQQRLAQVA